MDTSKMTLKERVAAFEMFRLPGQPKSMHMGTLNLVTDLWKEVQRLEDELSLMIDHKSLEG
jgi:hypothetical protein